VPIKKYYAHASSGHRSLPDADPAEETMTEKVAEAASMETAQHSAAVAAKKAAEQAGRMNLRN
jgi:hypothetical protein